MSAKLLTGTAGMWIRHLLLELELVSEGVSPDLVLIYRRLPGGSSDAQGNYSVSGLRYEVEHSHDLLQWNPLVTTELETNLPASDSPIEIATVRAADPIYTGQSKWVMRLRVARQTEE